MSMIINPYLFNQSSWTAITLANLSSNSTGWLNYTLRNRLKSAALPTSFSECRIALRSGSFEGLNINKCYIGIKGSGSYDFNATPQQVFWSGSSSVSVTNSTTTAISDIVSLSKGSGEEIVISIFTNDINRDEYAVGTDSNSEVWYKSGDDASNVSPSGYTQLGTNQLAIDIFEYR